MAGGTGIPMLTSTLSSACVGGGETRSNAEKNMPKMTFFNIFVPLCDTLLSRLLVAAACHDQQPDAGMQLCSSGFGADSAVPKPGKWIKGDDTTIVSWCRNKILAAAFFTLTEKAEDLLDNSQTQGQV